MDNSVREFIAKMNEEAVRRDRYAKFKGADWDGVFPDHLSVYHPKYPKDTKKDSDAKTDSGNWLFQSCLRSYWG